MALDIITRSKVSQLNNTKKLITSGSFVDNGEIYIQPNAGIAVNVANLLTKVNTWTLATRTIVLANGLLDWSVGRVLTFYDDDVSNTYIGKATIVDDVGNTSTNLKVSALFDVPNGGRGEIANNDRVVRPSRPFSMAFTYLRWDLMEPTEGVISWTGYEGLNYAAIRFLRTHYPSMRFVYRPVMDYPTSTAVKQVPSWLASEISFTEYTGTSFGAGNSPDYTDPLLLTKWTNFLNILATDLRARGTTYTVECGLGAYGEGHHDASVPMPNDTLYSQYVSAHLSAFEDFAHVTMRRPTTSAVGRVGMFNDGVTNNSQVTAPTYTGSLWQWKHGCTYVSDRIRYRQVESYTSHNKTIVSQGAAFDADDVTYLTGKTVIINDKPYIVTAATATNPGTLTLDREYHEKPANDDYFYVITFPASQNHNDIAPTRVEPIADGDWWNSTNYAELETEMRLLGTSIFGTDPDSGEQTDGSTNMLDMLGYIGYRIAVDEIKILSQTSTITTGSGVNAAIRIKNTGIAKFYDKWNIELTLINSAGVISQTVILDQLADSIRVGDTDLEQYFTLTVGAGFYTVAIAIIDPMSSLPGVHFCQDGRSDKRYELCRIEVL